MKVLCRLTLLVSTAAAFYVNFDPFWNGDTPANFWNFLLSAGYLAAWSWFLRQKRSQKGLWFARIWWALTLAGVVSWLGLQYFSFPEAFIFLAWPAVFCLSQLFGISFPFRIPYGGLFLVFFGVCVVMLWLGFRQTRAAGGDST